ncbi:hypothetical protein SAMN03097699_2261 [Flavobacteriaceae bacterium MAR_2010_188]|nr:hypothetical protein SAMN03097699_2261 [Flavobacteriaceae bacterium MAR_2010_188]
MDTTKIKRYTVLGILFFLPVVFLIMLLPAKHNYTALDIVGENIKELSTLDGEEEIALTDHITVLGFLGKHPLDNVTSASNLKEMIYDKFRGFKKFQIILISANGTEEDVERLKEEINDYESLKFFHFVFASPAEILGIFNSLDSNIALDANLSSQYVYIIDKELNQRGRIEDRISNSGKIRKTPTPLTSYNTIEVAELKNKMSEDMRVLLTEYRQKRKGEFNSTVRRAEDLKNDGE